MRPTIWRSLRIVATSYQVLFLYVTFATFRWKQTNWFRDWISLNLILKLRLENEIEWHSKCNRLYMYEKRPIGLRLKNELKWHSRCNRLYNFLQLEFHSISATLCNALHSLQHTATHCNTLRHTATHCKTLQHSAFAATHCSTLQHTATHCNTLQRTVTLRIRRNTLQHTATHRNTEFHPISLLHLEWHSISIFILNLIGLWSTERGKRDLENYIFDEDLGLEKYHSKCNRMY